MTRFIVCYDIADDRRRRRIAELLDAYGDRIQESVFELPIETSLMDKCMNELIKALDQKEDSLTVYRLCASCDDSREYYGVATALRNIGGEEVFVV